jgi:hypothetical protein
MQPNVRRMTLPTNQGYVDQLYARERAHVRRLRLVKLGCGGETTQSMITGRGNKFARALHCHLLAGRS